VDENIPGASQRIGKNRECARQLCGAGAGAASQKDGEKRIGTDLLEGALDTLSRCVLAREAVDRLGTAE
jgi:hypothetical protein